MTTCLTKQVSHLIFRFGKLSLRTQRVIQGHPLKSCICCFVTRMYVLGLYYNYGLLWSFTMHNLSESSYISS